MPFWASTKQSLTSKLSQLRFSRRRDDTEPLAPNLDGHLENGKETSATSSNRSEKGIFTKVNSFVDICVCLRIDKSILRRKEIADLDHPTPMQNCGRECFIIAAHQVIFYTPPLVHHIKTNEGKEQAGLDRVMKNVLANYLAKKGFTSCTNILDLYPGYKKGKPHDSNEFLQSHYERYFKTAFSLPQETRTWKCSVCEYMKITGPEGAILSLPPPPPTNKNSPGYMATFKEDKEGKEKEDRHCDFCDCERSGTVKSEYAFSNMIMVFANPKATITMFEDVVDLSSIEPGTEGTDGLWNLSGVVWHIKREKEEDSHYVAVVKHKDEFYLMNDHNYTNMGSNPDYDLLRAYYGKAQYAVYYRSTWKERMDARSQRQ